MSGQTVTDSGGSRAPTLLHALRAFVWLRWRLVANSIVVLYREDDAKSKDAAMRIAHDNENTFLVPAKLQLVPHPTSRTAPKELDSEKPPL